MKLSIIMPVYNESSTIKLILGKVEHINIDKEIIVINDGSTDETTEILKGELGSHITAIHSKVNLGKGAAIKEGLKYVTGDIVIVQDTDLELSPDDIPHVIKPIIDGTSHVVYGSRYFYGRGKNPFIGFVANRFLVLLTNILYGVSLTDIETAYKAFRVGVVRDIKFDCSGFEWEVEITAKILRKGFKIYEVPVSFNPRTKCEGKKINWIDGLKAIYFLFKYRIIR